MKTVYDAANAIEAHMVCHLLKQEHITAQVLGEHLQGAIGELPAAGLVRVVVDEDDWPRARAAIEQWEATQAPSSPHEAGAATRTAALPKAALVGVLGLLLGVGMAGLYFRAPLVEDGVDHNRDGVLDQRWFHSPAGQLLRVESDRILDGRPDRIDRFDERGIPQRTELDDDFDGRFETTATLRRGEFEFMHTDADGDGHAELVEHHAHGVPDSRRFIDRASGHTLREESLRFGRIEQADLDTDLDGRFDTRVRYTPLGEVASRESLPR